MKQVLAIQMGIENRGRKAVPYAQKRYGKRGGQIDYQFVLVGKVGKNEVTFYTKNALFWTKKSALRVCFLPLEE